MAADGTPRITWHGKDFAAITEIVKLGDVEIAVQVPDLFDPWLRRFYAALVACERIEGANRIASAHVIEMLACRFLQQGGTLESWHRHEAELGVAKSKTRAPRSAIQPVVKWCFGGKPDSDGRLARVSAAFDAWLALGTERPDPTPRDGEPGTSQLAEWLRRTPGGYQAVAKAHNARLERDRRRDSRSVKPGNPHGPREGLYLGDCLDRLATQEDASINLIVTSPPYADARKSVYGRIPADQYVVWWLERAEHFRRVLTRNGSLVVNIKEGSEQGERSTYVIELILAMRRAGWLWTEEYIWHKRNCAPGRWPTRFRDAWERCLHLTLDRDFAMYQQAVMVPMGDWAKSRLSNLSEIDCIRDPSASGSPFAKNVSNWLDRDSVYPTNVLHFATECRYVGHSAAFPEELPEFFIKLFTRKGETVCDPFLGSGTTGVVCARLKRRFIGIDILAENIRLAQTRISEARLGVAAN